VWRFLHSERCERRIANLTYIQGCDGGMANPTGMRLEVREGDGKSRTAESVSKSGGRQGMNEGRL